ncbi:tRNA (guanine(46)-N(7))-methyltransferase TrmB [Alloalcanivorax gelatiniphagus]|uniref:tRNA (guanine(46)-N(7))-methyltransferase n=1 Tax=Alloalcanivorax gelatiniphagus TaxID=1194167 RepID=A0ABY2XNB2_9GAMM|nr:methyltransferase domain-containing protein [Alloalcanivorax gelatiniphagus]TMW13938.1 methyltransferase domain-containing protein [Alloalcanivorax gelatiniphagus]|tara:strand:+ start:1382 stop:2047 length:666 start_codon:yes stop_codon:yes gene_type:complete
MSGNSRPVTSNQAEPHPALADTVGRHLAHPWRAPLADHDREAFQRARDWLGDSDAPLILDSGCGTGRSSVLLGQRYPQARVLGLDQSAHRLARAPRRFPIPDNVLLLRTDCAGFWRLAEAAGWRPWRHYVLYPNPWPKSAHLKRRWHGHPVFPHLLGLGGTLVLRTNWELYAREMAGALALAGRQASVSALAGGQPPVTDFEEKYRHSGHRLWELVADLDH